MNISTAQHKAAGELIDLVASKLSSNRAVHPETAIATAARLSGSLLFRSFKLKVQAQPGTIVLSNEANEEGPELIGIMAAMLRHFQVNLDQERLKEKFSIEENAPRLSLIESLNLLQEDAIRITGENGLALKEAAQSSAIATAFLIKECATNIPPEVGFNIATYGFIEGCKTVPPSMDDNSSSSVEKKPWYKLW